MSPRVHLLSDTTGPVNAVCLSQLFTVLEAHLVILQSFTTLR